MTIPEILLMLAEIAAAQMVVTSPENRRRRVAAVESWMRGLDMGGGRAAAPYQEQIKALHEWRKAEIAKASEKVRASFGISSAEQSRTVSASMTRGDESSGSPQPGTSPDSHRL